MFLRLLICFALFCTAQSAWACGNSADYFGCSYNIYYEIPKEWEQVEKPLIELEGAREHYDSHAEHFAKYVNRYPLRNLFDAKADTAWVEGVYGDGNGFHFSVESNKGPLKIVGLQAVNGYAKNKTVWAANNRIKKISIASDKTASPVMVELKDVMEPQKISFSPIESASLLIEIAETYAGTSPENDTALSELQFILADGSVWPSPQKYWLETIPGSKFSKGGPKIITDMPLATATADVRVVDASGKTIFSKHFPDEAPDIGDAHNVEPHANLFSRNRYLLRGGFLVDLQKQPVKEKELNPKILRTTEGGGRSFYQGIFPIRFSENETQVCIYRRSENSDELLIMKAPEGTLVNRKSLAKNESKELSKLYPLCGSLLHQ